MTPEHLRLTVATAIRSVHGSMPLDDRELDAAILVVLEAAMDEIGTGHVEGMFKGRIRRLIAKPA